jgi:hypothetical protein
VPIDSIGFQHDFYTEGVESNVNEPVLRAREHRDARLLQDLNEGEDPNARINDVVSFVTILHTRTKSFRDSFGGAMRQGVESLHNKLTSVDGQARLMKLWESRLGAMSVDELRAEIANKEAFDELLAEKGPDALLSLIRSNPSRAAPHAMSSLFAALHLVDLTTAGARRGQIRAVNTLLDQEAVEQILRAARWSVVSFDQDSLILGDLCVVAVDRSGQSGPLARFGASTSEVYLPISSSRVLVGTIDGRLTSPRLDASELNRASASCSTEHFFARSCTEAERLLCASIGTNAWLISPVDINQVIDEALEE